MSKSGTFKGDHTILSSPSLLENRGLISGEWRHSPSMKNFPVYEPSSGTVLHSVADFCREALVEAIDSAYEVYQNDFGRTTAKERATMLHQWHRLILDNKEDLSLILSLENRKPLVEASGEVDYAASFVQWFAEEAVRNYGDQIPSSYSDTLVMASKEPVGVCGIITPWNFPAAMITRKVAPALSAGCAVVIKPPSETPLTALALAKLAISAGIPTSCLHVIPTKNRQASLELATNPKVAKISFTGSTGVGKMITEVAAKTMKRVSMELGGNAPFIVFEDADIDVAVAACMVCKFRCSGQTCVCANRLIVHESVVEIFTKKLVEKVEALKLGKGIAEGTTQGPLVNKGAVEKVKSHVDDALAKGATLRTGGKAPEKLRDGYFFEPTVITDVTPEMAVATDETFGPLAAIFSFKTDAEAITLANSTEFGLAAYFFSKNLQKIQHVAKSLQCGMIGVNTGLISAAESPFGGVKESGIGREGSKYGLAEYQNIKCVTISLR